MPTHLAAAGLLTTLAGQPFCTSHDELQDYTQAMTTGRTSAAALYRTCRALPAGLAVTVLADVTDEPRREAKVRTLWVRVSGTGERPMVGYTFVPLGP